MLKLNAVRAWFFAMRRAKLISGEHGPIFRHASLPIGQQAASLEYAGHPAAWATRHFRPAADLFVGFEPCTPSEPRVDDTLHKHAIVLYLREILDVLLKHEARGTGP